MSPPVLHKPDPKNTAVRLSERAARTAEQPISYLMHMAVANPQIISLAAGMVDQETLPATVTQESVAELLSPPGAGQALQYGTTQGYQKLRELAVAHLEQLENCSVASWDIDPGSVVITTGSQQLLQLVGDVLIDPGDIVIMGAPDYFVYMGALAGLGARVIGATIDEHGLVPESLEEVLSRLDGAGELERVKLVYCTSYYQNPTGVTLSHDRRAAILEIVEKWSSRHRIFILEDAAYRELSYGEPGPCSIRSLDTAGRTVILAHTFSKSFSPGIKVGYSFLPKELLVPLLQQKGNHDFGSPNFNQHVMARVLESGRYADHVLRLRGVYRAKLGAMLESLEAEFAGHPARPAWTRPAGGLYVWLTFPAHVDTTRDGVLFQRCLEQGVLYVPGAYCFPPEWREGERNPLGGPRHTMRLSFGVQSIAGIRQGIRRLAAAAK